MKILYKLKRIIHADNVQIKLDNNMNITCKSLACYLTEIAYALLKRIIFGDNVYTWN